MIKGLNLSYFNSSLQQSSKCHKSEIHQSLLVNKTMAYYWLACFLSQYTQSSPNLRESKCF